MVHVRDAIYLELKRLKLVDMTGRLKLGRSTAFLVPLGGFEASGGSSCGGTICWNRLREHANQSSIPTRRTPMSRAGGLYSYVLNKRSCRLCFELELPVTGTPSSWPGALFCVGSVADLSRPFCVMLAAISDAA